MQETALSTSNEGEFVQSATALDGLLEKGDLQAREMPHIGLLIVLAKD